KGIVNNAGAIDFEAWDDLTMESWDHVFEVNLNAILLISHHFGRRLDRGGAIVNVASTDGMIGSYGSISYSASKAALINLTKSLGNVLGALGVRANAVTPGWINTSMSTEESFDAVQLTPLGRNGLASEVARLV